MSPGLIAGRNDLDKSHSVVNQLSAHVQQHGSIQQRQQVLALQLPGSELYPPLEGRLPPPSHTFLRLVEITEEHETRLINHRIGERRTRLDSMEQGIQQVTTKVKQEVFAASDLEELYQGLIDCTDDDELRRHYEEKLVQRVYDHLVILPPKEKAAKRSKLMELCRGLVILKHPFKLAWDVTIEWNDAQNISELDVSNLRHYVHFFPHTGLSDIINGYLLTPLSPFPATQLDPEDETSGGVSLLTAEDGMELLKVSVPVRRPRLHRY